MSQLKAALFTPRRTLAIGTGALVAVGGLASIPLLAHPSVTGSTRAAAAASSTTLTVAADGTGQYTTVQAAINAVPANSGKAYTISVAKGTYKEVVSVPSTKKNLTLKGATGELLVRNGDRADHPLLRLPLPHHR